MNQQHPLREMIAINLLMYKSASFKLYRSQLFLNLAHVGCPYTLGFLKLLWFARRYVCMCVCVRVSVFCVCMCLCLCLCVCQCVSTPEGITNQLRDMV